MAHFLFQWTYKDSAIQAMLDKPQDRPGELRKAVEAFGGKVHQFFFVFGTYDGVAVLEFPDIESCAACNLTLAGAGANRTQSTTLLLSPAESLARCRRRAKREPAISPPSATRFRPLGSGAIESPNANRLSAPRRLRTGPSRWVSCRSNCSMAPWVRA